MSILLSVAAFVALASVSVLCIYLVQVLGDVRRAIHDGIISLSVLTNEVKMIRQQTEPIWMDLAVTAKYSASISEKVDKQLDKTDSAVNEAADIVHRVSDLEKYVHHNIVAPVNKIISIVSSVTKAADAFSKVMKRGK